MRPLRAVWHRGLVPVRRRGECGANAALWPSSEKDAKLAQKLGQPQHFIAVSPQECVGQLAYSAPT
jgi:hypothetical protein